MSYLLPLGVGEASRGLADGADKGPEHWAGHQSRGVLESVTPVLSFSLAIGVAELASIENRIHPQELEQSWLQRKDPIQEWCRSTGPQEL